MTIEKELVYYWHCDACQSSWQERSKEDSHRWEWRKDLCFCGKQARTMGYSHTFVENIRIEPLYRYHYHIFVSTILVLFRYKIGEVEGVYVTQIDARTKEDAEGFLSRAFLACPQLEEKAFYTACSRAFLGLPNRDLLKTIPFPKQAPPCKGQVMLEIHNGNYPVIARIEEVACRSDGAQVIMSYAPSEHEPTSQMVRYYGESRYHQPDGYYPCDDVFLKECSFAPSENESYESRRYHVYLLSPDEKMEFLGHTFRDYLSSL